MATIQHIEIREVSVPVTIEDAVLIERNKKFQSGKCLTCGKRKLEQYRRGQCRACVTVRDKSIDSGALTEMQWIQSGRMLERNSELHRSQKNSVVDEIKQATS